MKTKLPILLIAFALCSCVSETTISPGGSTVTVRRVDPIAISAGVAVSSQYLNRKIYREK